MAHRTKRPVSRLGIVIISGSDGREDGDKNELVHVIAALIAGADDFRLRDLPKLLKGHLTTEFMTDKKVSSYKLIITMCNELQCMCQRRQTDKCNSATRRHDVVRMVRNSILRVNGELTVTHGFTTIT